MTKYEWDKRLRRGLESLPQEERQRVYEYYDELFEDKIDEGLKESDIVAKLGSPEAAAQKILADYGMYLERGEPCPEAEVSVHNAFCADNAPVAPQESRTEQQAPPEKTVQSFDCVAAKERDFAYESDKKQTEAEPFKADTEELLTQSEAKAQETVAGRSFGGDYDIITASSDSKYSLVRKLKLNMAETDVVIRKADRFALRFKEDKNTKYSIEASRDTLYVKEKYIRHFQFFNFKNRPKTVVIDLPECDEVTFDSVKRGCEVEGHKVRRMSLKTVNGDLLVKNCSTEYLSLSAVSGDAAVDGGSHDGVTVSTTNGDVKLKDASVKDLALVSTSGDITAGGVSASGKTVLKSMSGDIIVSGISCCDADFKTMSGDIDVNVLANPDNFTVKASSVTGDIKSPRGGEGRYKLTVASMSGDVKLSFLK